MNHLRITGSPYAILLCDVWFDVELLTLPFLVKEGDDNKNWLDYRIPRGWFGDNC